MLKKLLITILCALTWPAFAQQGPVAEQPSQTVEACHVFKTGSALYYGGMVTSGASAGFVMLFNATSAPADGAVVPYLPAVQLPANSTVGINPSVAPILFPTGLTICFSTTGPFTKTASSTAVFGAQVQ